MLRDVIVHLLNDQPLLADLAEPPQPGDAALVCTNLRSMNGKVPSFVTRSDSTFVFPLSHVRFVEVPARALADAEVDPIEAAAGAARDRGRRSSGHDDSDTQTERASDIPDPFDARADDSSNRAIELPAVAPATDGGQGWGGDDDGEALLRRIRDL